MVKGVTMAMVVGEPMLVLWRVEDLGKALDASRDTGLPITSTCEVAVQVVERIRGWLKEDDPELEEDT